MSCACCGADKPTVALPSRDDVALCRHCVGWLAGQLGVTSTPTLPVANLREAVTFYERAGFGVRVYSDGTYAEPGFAFVDYDGESVFDLDAVGDLDPATNHAGCYLIVSDADAWHRKMTEAGLSVTAIANQPWGMREFALNDPSGNHVRIGTANQDDDSVSMTMSWTPPSCW